MFSIASPSLWRLRNPGWLAPLWRSRCIPFVLASAAFLASNAYYRNESFYWDSLEYWELGQQLFLEDGSFSFLRFEAPFRGYLFPLILGCVSYLARILSIDGLLFCRILTAFFFGALTSALAPAAYCKATGRRVSGLETLFFSGMVLLFWRGYAAYPLSDFPAVACLMVGYMLFPFSGAADGRSCLRTILAGFCVASATIIRPTYQVVLILLACYVVIKSAWNPKSVTKQFSFQVSLALIGMAAACAPQLALNIVHKGSYSPFVSGQGLYAQQLTWGIRMQRYDTNVGESYPQAKMIFIDPVGDAICKIENLDGERPLTYSAYFGLVAKYPVDFAGIYVRHLFNGLDHTYSTPYVKNVNRSIAFSLVNYILILLAMLILLDLKPAWNGNSAAARFSLVFISPAILSVPGAMETRFFLPIHLLVYAVVSFGLPAGAWREGTVARLIRRHWLWAHLWILFSFVLSSLTFATLQHGAVLLGVP